MKKCPICEQGTLTLKEGINEVVHKEKHGRVDFFYEVCDNCGSEQVDEELALQNKRMMIEFHKQVDN